MRGRDLALVPLLLVAGCTETQWSVLPYPIPLELAGAGGGLLAQASVDGTSAPFPVAVDTGTILTTYDDGTGRTSARNGDLTMYGIDAGGAAIPRLSITNVALFQAPLGHYGVGGDAVPVGGVIGGDNLSRFAVGLDYRGAAPAMTLVSTLTQCSCALAPSCTAQDACYAVLPFSLAGGQDTGLQGQTRIALGNDQYSYPPTRVLLAACAEPLPDPVTTQACVLPGDSCPGNPAYVPSGVDMQFAVATGFPGVALSANAYDRLRGAGAARALLAGPTTTLHLVDLSDEGASAGGVQAALTTIGRAPAAGDGGASALAFVSTNHRFYGPCGLVAQSRRIRRAYIAATPADDAAEAAAGYKICSGEHCCLLDPNNCPGRGSDYIQQCQSTINSNVCNDASSDTPVPAVLELKTPMPVYVLDDLTPLFVGLNADVRPNVATVDGVIGTAALSRVVSTIDYPGGRFIAQCVREDDCVAYPRLSNPSAGDCGFCHGQLDLKQCPDLPGLRACPPAP